MSRKGDPICPATGTSRRTLRPRQDDYLIAGRRYRVLFETGLNRRLGICRSILGDRMPSLRTTLARLSLRASVMKLENEGRYIAGRNDATEETGASAVDETSRGGSCTGRSQRGRIALRSSRAASCATSRDGRCQCLREGR
jgi:hypothetical protein